MLILTLSVKWASRAIAIALITVALMSGVLAQAVDKIGRFVAPGEVLQQNFYYFAHSPVKARYVMFRACTKRRFEFTVLSSPRIERMISQTAELIKQFGLEEVPQANYLFGYEPNCAPERDGVAESEERHPPIELWIAETKDALPQTERTVSFCQISYDEYLISDIRQTKARADIRNALQNIAKDLKSGRIQSAMVWSTFWRKQNKAMRSFLAFVTKERQRLKIIDNELEIRYFVEPPAQYQELESRPPHFSPHQIRVITMKINPNCQ